MLSKSRFDTFCQRVIYTTLAAAIVISGVSPSVAAGGGGGHGGSGAGRGGGLGGERGFGSDHFVVGAGRSRSRFAGFDRESRHCSPSLVERYSYGCSPLKVPYGPYGR